MLARVTGSVDACSISFSWPIIHPNTLGPPYTHQFYFTEHLHMFTRHIDLRVPCLNTSRRSYITLRNLRFQGLAPFVRLCQGGQTSGSGTMREDLCSTNNVRIAAKRSRDVAFVRRSISHRRKSQMSARSYLR